MPLICYHSWLFILFWNNLATVLMFKESFKHYKAKWPTPDLSDVLNFDEPLQAGVKDVFVEQTKDINNIPLGVKHPSKWRCFKVEYRPGLIVIKNPFTPAGQRYWICQCLQNYPKSPNIVNLNAKQFKADVINDWWKALQSCQDKELRKKMKTAMRWTTLGYHHDWDTKVYNEEMKNKFPDDLSKLSQFFAKILGFEKYSAEAAIVNYYPIGTTLAGHTDHSEADLNAPLFSMSFGQKAIFLLGGQTKEEKPSAMFLKSGDVIVMSKESRVCYHAVPRVMKDDKELWNDFDPEFQDMQILKTDQVHDSPPYAKKFRREDSINSDDENFYIHLETFHKCSSDQNFWSPFREYLNDSRINLNVRQVLKQGQTSL